MLLILLYVEVFVELRVGTFRVNLLTGSAALFIFFDVIFFTGLFATDGFEFGIVKLRVNRRV